MARPVTSKVKKFSLTESEVIEENERILSQKIEQHTPAAKVETAPHDVAQPDTEPQQSDVVQPQTTTQTATSTPRSVVTAPETTPQQPAPTEQTPSTPAPQSVVTAPETTPQQPAPTEQTSAAPAGSPATGLKELAAMRKPKGKKTENGITVYVPMEYYERIALMKMRTGIPIRDLALQAVIEFLDRNMA